MSRKGKPVPARATAKATDLAAVLAAGMAHHGAGRLAEAEAAYRQVLTARPDQADALHLMGVIALQVNKPAVAAELIAQAIRHHDRNPAYFSNLGSALRRLGRAEEALAAYRRALALDADFTDGLTNLGNLLAEQNRHGEAVPVLRRLLGLKPQLADPRLLLARSLILEGQAEEAVTELNTLIGQAPLLAPAWINLGVALRKLGRTRDAEAAYRRVLELSPNDTGALNNLGILLQDEDRYEEAIACIEQAIAINPASADSHLNLSLILRCEMRIEESIREARETIRLDPNQSRAHTNLGFCLLIQGKLPEGFAEYEWRSQMDDFSSPKRNFPSPAWKGGNPAGLTLLVHDEQGVGDSIQFARYAQLLQSRGARVFVECNSQLSRLFSAMPGVAGALGRFTPLPPHDAHVSLLSLPLLLGTTLETIPAGVPYLRTEPEQVARWAGRLGPRRGLRVGLVWAGNPEFKADRIRSPRLAAYRPLLELPGIEFFALQKGAGRQDIETYGPLPPDFTDLGAEIADFADTAAIMSNLDLVISSCTAPAHLAGALGRPAWTVLPFAPDWRWLERGDTSPWYPSMRLFRQDRRGDWEPVIGRVRAALTDAAGRKQEP